MIQQRRNSRQKQSVDIVWNVLFLSFCSSSLGQFRSLDDSWVETDCSTFPFIVSACLGFGVFNRIETLRSIDTNAELPASSCWAPKVQATVALHPSIPRGIATRHHRKRMILGSTAGTSSTQ